MIDTVRTTIRSLVRRMVPTLLRISGGRLTPDGVTIFGFVMHIPIAVLIGMQEYNILAAVLLIIFGLFDTLDGELARLQGAASASGMLLDATTDRLKEMLVYTGAGYALAMGPHPELAALAVAACGASLSVSYVKAKGEAAVASSGKKIPHSVLNKLFSDGLLPFELRIIVVVIGLLGNQLAVALAFITAVASYTVLQRLIRISREI